MKKQKQRHSIPPVGQLLEMAAQAAGARVGRSAWMN